MEPAPGMLTLFTSTLILTPTEPRVIGLARLQVLTSSSSAPWLSTPVLFRVIGTAVAVAIFTFKAPPVFTVTDGVPPKAEALVAIARVPSLTTVAPFFFQAEDGIRDTSVTGVQTCALPI